MIELTRVPFGTVHVNPEAIGMITPAKSDPFGGYYNGAKYGCCILIQGEEIRVLETATQVETLMNGGVTYEKSPKPKKK